MVWKVACVFHNPTSATICSPNLALWTSNNTCIFHVLLQHDKINANSLLLAAEGTHAILYHNMLFLYNKQFFNKTEIVILG